MLLEVGMIVLALTVKNIFFGWYLQGTVIALFEYNLCIKAEVYFTFYLQSFIL